MTQEYADLVGLGLQFRLETIGRELLRLQELVVTLQKEAVKIEEVPLTPSKRGWTEARRKKFYATLKQKKKGG